MSARMARVALARAMQQQKLPIFDFFSKIRFLAPNAP
jgi:hypothetical protein